MCTLFRRWFIAVVRQFQNASNHGTQDNLSKEEEPDQGAHVGAVSIKVKKIRKRRLSHGELTNYSNIARECGVDSKTVKEYYQILVDTLLGRMVEPFKRRQDRGVITRAAKFYLFDVGVAGPSLSDAWK